MNPNETPESIVSRVIAGEHNSEDIDYLIEHFSKGHSLELLDRLMVSNTCGVAADALYVLSELGSTGWTFADRAGEFLEYPDDDARFFAISCVLVAPHAVRTETLLSVLDRLGDSSKRVRWKAIDFAATIDKRFLVEVLDKIPEDNIYSQQHLFGLSLLTETASGLFGKIMTSMRSSDSIERAYAVAAAARLATEAAGLLQEASKSHDQAVSEFASPLLSRQRNV